MAIMTLLNIDRYKIILVRKGKWPLFSDSYFKIMKFNYNKNKYVRCGRVYVEDLRGATDAQRRNYLVKQLGLTGNIEWVVE